MQGATARPIADGSIGVRHIHVNARMEIDPVDISHLPLEMDRSLGVELRRECVVDPYRQGCCEETNYQAAGFVLIEIFPLVNLNLVSR